MTPSMKGTFNHGPFRFDLVDADGAPLPDGSYTYELTATPDGVLAEGLPTQSGVFSILGGSGVSPDEVEENDSSGGYSLLGGTPSDATPLDQVILDDLIVDGSACIGLDCVNGESFGFDTIRRTTCGSKLKTPVPHPAFPPTTGSSPSTTLPTAGPTNSPSMTLTAEEPPSPSRRVLPAIPSMWTTADGLVSEPPLPSRTST